MQPPPLAAQFEDRRGGKPRQRLRDINRRLGHVLGHVSDGAASRCGNGGRRLPLSKWSARNQASSSPCPPKTRARCAAASLLPASSLRCSPPRLDSAVSAGAPAWSLPRLLVPQ